MVGIGFVCVCGNCGFDVLNLMIISTRDGVFDGLC
jgi:hypothetical protein